MKRIQIWIAPILTGLTAVRPMVAVPRTLLAVLGLALFSASLSQGAVTACNTGTVGVDIPTPAAITNGCSSIDLNFVNLGTSFTQRYWATAGTISTGPNPDTISTTTLHINGCNATGGGGAPAACTNSTNNVFADATNNGAAVTGTSTVAVMNNGTNAPSESGRHWVLSGLSVISPTLNSLTGTDVVSATTTFCLGSIDSATAGVGGCLVGNVGSFRLTWSASTGNTVLDNLTGLAVGNTTGGGTGIVGAIYTLPTALRFYTQAYISTAFSINAATPSVSILDFGYGFDEIAETPEPSTFGMLGAALAGLGILAHKRRRRLRTLQ